MGDYRPDTCAYCQAATWCEIRRNGKPQCRACKVERFFDEYLYPPLGFKLLDWQRRFLRTIYGTVDADGLRKYRRAYRSLGKKGGKSFLVGGLPLYHLCAEDVDRPAAYGAAAAKGQASIVFHAATALIQANPDLKWRLKILESTKKILRYDGGGGYEVLSADGDVNDGVEPSLVIIDELHRWKTKKAEAMFAILTKGTLSRAEPLVVEVTTAGDEFDSPLWFSEHSFAQRLIEGTAQSESFYAEISCADSKRIAAEPDYWKSREARVAANPSHEDLGGFMKDERLVEELNIALAQPEKYCEYLRFHLNVPSSSGSNPIIEMPIWREGGGSVDMSSMAKYDPEFLVDTWGLRNRPCFAGIDASWTTDFTALQLIFPPVGEEDMWRFVGFCWVPRDRMPQLERKTRQPLKDWARRGFLGVTPGNAVDIRELTKRLRWAAERFDLREVGYDPWNFRETANNLMDEGFACVEVRQGYPSLTAPTKKILELYLNRKLVHGNNPVMNWHASCLSIDSENDNCKFSKPARDMSAKRIDLFAAGATGMNRAMLAVAVKSAYSNASEIVI